MKLKHLANKKATLSGIGAFFAVVSVVSVALTHLVFAAGQPNADIIGISGRECVANIATGNRQNKMNDIVNDLNKNDFANEGHFNIINGYNDEFGFGQTTYTGVDTADQADVKASVLTANGPYIYFSAWNSHNKQYNAECGGSAFLWQSPDRSKSTTFYGIENAGSGVKRGGITSAYIFVKATVNPSQGTVNISFSHADSNEKIASTKNYPDLQVTDPGKLFQQPALFPAGGGTGGAGGSCLGVARDTAAVKACLQTAGTATMTDAATITFAGDTYVADKWIGPTIHYKLTKSSDPNRQKSNTSGSSVPEILMDTQSNYDDINLDNGGEAGEITNLVDALKNLDAAGHIEKNAFNFRNYSYDGNPTGGATVSLPVNTENINILFNYSPKDDAAQIVFKDGGDNEKHYLGPYKKASPLNYTLASGGFSSCNKTEPTLIFSAAPQPSTVTTATFDMTAPDCSFPPSGVGFTVRTRILAADASLPVQTTTGTPGTTSDANALDCNFDGNPLTYFVCPLVDGMKSLINKADGYITSSLQFDKGDSAVFSGKNMASYYSAWNAFRVLGTALIVIGGLVMVAAQAFGLEILDAYTLRKVMPRLLIAVIGMSLSWPLMQFVVQFFNVLGVDVRQLIWTPFGSLHGTLNSGTLLTANLALLATGIFLGILGALSFGLTAVLALLVGFAIIVFRDMGLILLVIIAPLGIACYVLPNTQKLWKLWIDNFLGLLVVFPIIEAFIAIGRVFSAISLGPDATATTAPAAGTIGQVIGFAAYFAPYFLLPVAFRLATGVIGSVAGFMNDRGRGAFDRLKKYRGGQLEKRSAHYGDKYGAKVLQAKATAVRGLNDRASRSGRVGGAAMRFAGRRIEGIDNLEARMSELNARRGKQLGDQIATGKDDEIRGLTVNQAAARRAGALTQANNFNNGLMRKTEDGTTQYKSLGGGWVNESDVVNGQKRWGRDVSAQQAALSYEMRKAMTNEEVAGISSRYRSLAKDTWGMTDTQAGGSWIGAGFENQNQHLEFKNTDWSNGKLNVEKFSKEAYEKKGSYQLSQMSGHTIEQLDSAYREAGRTGDRDSQDRIKAVAETFMHQLGGAGNVDAAGNLIPPTPGGASSGRRTVSSNGAGAIGEAVYRLAETTGVIAAPPNNPASPGSAQTNP